MSRWVSRLDGIVKQRLGGVILISLLSASIYGRNALNTRTLFYLPFYFPPSSVLCFSPVIRIAMTSP